MSMAFRVSYKNKVNSRAIRGIFTHRALAANVSSKASNTLIVL